jgi:uncharacterized protein YhbP (UPF0306 family)
MSTKTTSFEQHLREMFELYDDDGSGGIDQLELRALMAQLGIDLTDDELSAMIAEADVDGDGDIDYEEFAALFKGIKVSGEEKKKKKQQQQQQKKEVLQRKYSITRGIFDDAKQLMSFTSIFRFVTWLYSERKMILLACSHFVATMVIWGECAFYCLDLMEYRLVFIPTSSHFIPVFHSSAHFALIKFQQQENAVPEGAPRYWAKRLVPPIEFGSMHASTSYCNIM